MSKKILITVILSITLLLGITVKAQAHHFELNYQNDDREECRNNQCMNDCINTNSNKVTNGYVHHNEHETITNQHHNIAFARYRGYHH